MPAIRKRWEEKAKKKRFDHENPENKRNSEMSYEDDGEEVSLRRLDEIIEKDAMDAQMGFGRMTGGCVQNGWMTNMRSTLIKEAEWPSGRSALDFYFLQEDGAGFKVTLAFSPYFYIKCRDGRESEVEEYLRRKFGSTIEAVQRILKEDLEMPNHVSGKRALYIKLSFRNTYDLVKVRNSILPSAQRSQDSQVSVSVTSSLPSSHIIGLREHDVPYHLRVAIDLDIRCGLWYSVSVAGTKVQLERIKGKDVRPDPIVLAFDIETSKKPLKFPDASEDPIMMISYMVDGRGFLITNREILSKDLEDFEYTPLPEYTGKFKIYNEASEAAMLNRFFAHIQQIRPLIIASYNGDNFDWPYIEKRALANDMVMHQFIGVKRSLGAGGDTEYTFSYGTHMDCFCWVKRDSYLPVGSQGLKAVAKTKLGYNPIELDPEEMTPLARSDPQTLANYSVSDAVATYYLYMKYVNPFIFSLCTLIPLTPDEVLRKGSGTLCETLLMAEAFKVNIIYPNKHSEEKEKFWNGHLLDGETYVGGHVESLEAGVFRSDLKYKFKICPDAVDQLILDLERALCFFLTNEGVKDKADVLNYSTVFEDIKGRLSTLKADPNRLDRPLIYHLDVGAMYPNIILTNRLQPPAVVTEANCAVCDYNVPGKNCQRPLTWTWRGEFYVANKGEYRMIKGQLERERFSLKRSDRPMSFHELSSSEQQALINKRLAEYSQKVYKRTKQSEEVQRTSIVCMRENSFYVDTVRAYRDHRYTYKSLCKIWKKKLDEAQKSNDPASIESADKMHIVYDSLQLAHKCILNSFYGYVMRRGARWFSMEMGGIVCDTGAKIIRLARELIEKIGRPLELDTDGIWLMLPWDFPQNYTFELAGGKKLSCAYPCIMLNHLVHDQFTNHQYQTLTNRESHEYNTHSENSIFFEIDGPYKAMIMPSSTEEGKQLKKRYAVFNRDGSLAELKGFEVKRRGELNLIKIFQTQLFKTFLEGDTIEECYAAVSREANYWLDILDTKGSRLTDRELFDLLSENRSMSKALDEYEGQKSTSISTAKRLAEFLGDDMVKDRGGLSCQFIISEQPYGEPVNTRAVPVAIWSAEPEVRQHFLRAWLKDHSRNDFDIRTIIDWSYYKERFGSTVQKLIIIPAALQGLANPVPRVHPPDWLAKRIASLTSKSKQLKITEMFAPIGEKNTPSGYSLGGLCTFDSVNTLDATPICPPLETDYVGWLEYQKKHVWRTFEAAKQDVRKSKMTLDKYVSTTKNSLAKKPWHVLDIFEVKGHPGTFCLCALVDLNIKKIFLKHPRRFYVHCRQPIPESNFPISHCKLPHISRCTLYELTVSDESEYRNILPNLHTSIFAHPNVEGVYEAELDDPLKELIMKFGSVVKSMIDQKNLCSDDIISMPEIVYLDSFTNYACICVVETDNRAVWTLFTPSGCDVFVIDPFEKKQMGSAKAILQQYAQRNLFSNPDVPTNVSYVEGEQVIIRSMQKALSKSSIVFSNKEVFSDREDLHVFLFDFQDRILGPLDWQRAGLRRACEEVNRMGILLFDALRLSKYARLPLSFVLNIVQPNTRDKNVVLSDIFLSRTLKQNGYVLPKQNYDDLSESSVKASVNKPGLYLKVCVDLDISAMAINSVLEFNHLLEDPNAGMEQAGPPPIAFSILKNLLTCWIREAITPNSVYPKEAESMLMMFHRWTVTSKLVPTSWKELISCAIARCIYLLTDYVGRNGSQVISCDNNRLVLMTPRDNRQNAEAYMDWLIKDINSKESFSWLRLTPRKYYSSLLWHSVKDYVGVVNIDGQDKVDIRLNLSEHLPIVLRKPFSQAIAQYLLGTRNREQEDDTDLLHSGLDEEPGEDLALELKEKLIGIVVNIARGYSQAHHNLTSDMRFPKCLGSSLSEDFEKEGAAFVFCKFLHGLLSVDSPALSSALFKSLDKALLIAGDARSGFDMSFDFNHPIRADILEAATIDEYCCMQCNTVYCLDLLRGAPKCLCGATIDFTQVEATLIRKLHRATCLYSASDAVCKDCGDVRIGYLKMKCSKCPNGMYIRKTSGWSPDAIEVIRMLARMHGLSVLLALVPNIQ